MLVRHDVVLVLRVDGLVVRGHVDVVGGEAVLGEGLEEVGVARAVEVEGGEVGVFVLQGGRMGRERVLNVFGRVGGGGGKRRGLGCGEVGVGVIYCFGYMLFGRGRLAGRVFMALGKLGFTYHGGCGCSSDTLVNLPRRLDQWRPVHTAQTKDCLVLL